MWNVALLLGLLASVTGIAAPTSAATITHYFDRPSYAVGDTITLTVVGDLESDGEHEIYVRLFFDQQALTILSASQTTATSSGGSWLWDDNGLFFGPWHVGIFNQDNRTGNDLLVDGPVTTTITMRRETAGAINFYRTDVRNSLDVFYFGSMTLAEVAVPHIAAIPEPSTGLLVSTGLLGLAMRRRQRADV